MTNLQESLFSLELVIEKLYIPYVTCRFPAVAFRLLDFPTILISHVDQQLAQTIKQKINNDPYYQIPDQFSELQDKHGNFMIKKGKSCLFKISIDTLIVHLTNTPMYIMVIDEFPEIPKLLGNSSLALNEVMEAIKVDLKKTGHTVPSVHGDKGLFKIYSLMGKEIGYMILGFRVLSLGPGLIAHLPNTVLMKRASEKMTVDQSDSGKEEIVVLKQQQVLKSVPKSKYGEYKQQKDLNRTREIGSMTDAEMSNALIQTIDIEGEQIHVAVSENEKKVCKSSETQTEKQIKQRAKKSNNIKIMSEENASDDEIIINPNIICPPPLFYNSKAEPDVKIDRDIDVYSHYDSTSEYTALDDLSGDEINEHDEKENRKLQQFNGTKVLNIAGDMHYVQNTKSVVTSNINGLRKQDKLAPKFNVDTFSNEPIFPILTALLTELSKIQNPHLVKQAMQQVNEANKAVVQSQQPQEPEVTKPKSEEVLANITNNTANVSMTSGNRKGKKSHHKCPPPSEGVPKHKGWIRKAPEVTVKKTKLVFGLTNTQRLRLAKQNPSWLESAEKKEQAAKALKQKTIKHTEPELDMDTGNLSDTFTEVRRLAAAELTKSTLAQSNKLSDDPKVKKARKAGVRSRENSPAKRKHSRKRSQSPKTAKMSNLKVRDDSENDRFGKKSEQPLVNLEPDTEDIVSADMAKAEQLDSVADSILSSRIEVHIPSARAYESDDEDDEDTVSNDSIEIPDSSRKETKSKFPGFNEGDTTLPCSIEADNKSQNTTIDDDSPMESTRVSKQFRSGPKAGESLFKSTEEYDTKQFHSTDEPELQKLISDDEKSETQPTPITDRSVKSQWTSVSDKSGRSQTPVTDKSARSQSPAMTAASQRLSMKFEVLNPKASQQSPLPALQRSQQLKVDSLNARPTPTDTPLSRSSNSSLKQPIPQPRKQLRERKMEFKKDSIHTESVSSYMPSESENILSLISDGSYSDDFMHGSEKDSSSQLSTPDLPKLIAATKLGYTIH